MGKAKIQAKAPTRSFSPYQVALFTADTSNATDPLLWMNHPSESPTRYASFL